MATVDKKKLQNLFGGDATTQPSNVFEQDDIEEDTPITSYELTQQSDDFLNAYDDDTPSAPIIRDTDAKPPQTQDLVNDIDYALRVQQDLVNQAQKSVQIALNNAAQGTARDSEVLSTAIETAGNQVEKLLGLYEKIQKLSENKKSEDEGKTFVQNNIIFKGTTADALSAILEGKI